MSTQATGRDREMARKWAIYHIGLYVGVHVVEELAIVIARAREEGRREPRPITDAMVEAAVSAWMAKDLDEMTEDDIADGRRALEAAEKARTESLHG